MGRLLRGEGQDVQGLRHQRGPVVRRRDRQQAVCALEPHQALSLANPVQAGASNRNQATAKAEAEVVSPGTKHDDDGAGTRQGREGLTYAAGTTHPYPGAPEVQGAGRTSIRASGPCLGFYARSMESP